MREKFLPIGTVVLLKGGRKRAMITGFCSVAQENPEKIYDYSGCVYPEGYLSSNQVCLFDEEKVFKDKLNKIVNSLAQDGNQLTATESTPSTNSSEESFKPFTEEN